MENYVIMLSRSSQTPFCKVRISAHMLMIVKGRYLSYKVNPEDGLCKLCDRTEVEDEFHFFALINNKLLREYIDLDSFSDTEMFKLIMSTSEYDISLPFRIRHATSVPLGKGTKFALHHGKMSTTKYIHTYINNAYYSAFPQLIKALYNTKIDRIKYKAKMQTRNTSKKNQKMDMAQKN